MISANALHRHVTQFYKVRNLLSWPADRLMDTVHMMQHAELEARPIEKMIEQADVRRLKAAVKGPHELQRYSCLVRQARL